MSVLRAEIAAFNRRKSRMHEEARQMAAFFLSCGVDLAEALAASPAERERLLLRLERLIERERLRGAKRHWSYDLNRHIALKQALDRLRRHGETGTAGRREAARPPRRTARSA